MKITHNKVGQNLNLRDTAKADKTSKTGAKEVGFDKADALKDLGSTGTASKVDISAQAHNLKKAREIAMNTPDIREDKIAHMNHLQQLIDAGKYKVNARDIADKMVDEHASIDAHMSEE